MINDYETDPNLRSKWAGVILIYSYVSDGNIHIRESDWVITHYHAKTDLSTIK
jgi:hypothetical protein